MTSISLIYKKNTTGEQFDAPAASRVEYFGPDGRPVPDDEIQAVYAQYSKEAIARFRDRSSNKGPTDPVFIPGGYRIEVERDDGLPLTYDEANACVIADRLVWLHAAEEVEVITIPKSTLAIVNGLPQAGRPAWAEIVQQLEPDNDEQVITLPASEGLELLLDAALIERYVGGTENQFIVSRHVAYCSVERR